MRHIKFTLANLFLWLTLAIGCFYVENLAILTPNMNAGFDHSSFWILTISSFACMFMYFFLEHKYNHLKVDKVLLIVLAILTLIMLGTIWTQTTESFDWANGKGTNVVSFTMFEKIQYSFMLLFVMSFTYINLYSMFAHRVSNRTLLWLPIVFLIYVYGVIIFSLIKEPEEYFKILHGENGVVIGFYHNTNTFAMTLFLGILTCFVINYYKPNPITYFSIILFFGIMLFTNCASSTLLSIVVIPLLFILDIIRNAHKNLFRTVIITSISLFVFIMVFFAYIAFSQQENSLVSTLNISLERFIESIHTATFTGRTENWAYLMKYAFDNPWHAIFGRGFMTSMRYVPSIISAGRNSSIGGSTMADSGFVYTTFSMGMLGLLIYLGLIAYFGYCCVRLLLKKRFTFVGLYGISCLSLFAYNFFEANIFFDMGIKETYMTIVFLMPVLVANKHSIHKEATEETLNMKLDNLSYNPAKAGQIASIILLGALGAVTTTLLTPYAMTNSDYFKIAIIIIIALSALLLFLPYVIYLWTNNSNIYQTIIHVLANVSLLGLLFFVLFNFVKTNNLMIASIVVGGLFLLDVIIYACIRRDFFRNYLRITIIEPIKISLFPMIIAIFISAFIGIIFHMSCPFNTLTCLTLGLLYLVIFAIFVFLLPNMATKKIFKYLNIRTLNHYQEYLRRGK